MHSHASRKQITFVRVREFGEEHAADFAPTSLATQLFADIAEIIRTLDSHGATAATKDRNTRQGTASRAEAREKLRDTLSSYNKTARAMQPAVPGIEDKFRLPGSRDVDLLSAGRAFLVQAEPIQGEFIAREMPADFQDGLRADIQGLEDAISDQQSTLGQRVAALTLIDDSIDRGNAIVRELNAIVKNKYADSPGILAQWTSVKHTERQPRRSSSAVTTSPASEATPPTSTPSSPGSSSNSTSGNSGAPLA